MNFIVIVSIIYLIIALPTTMAVLFIFANSAKISNQLDTAKTTPWHGSTSGNLTASSPQQLPLTS